MLINLIISVDCGRRDCFILNQLLRCQESHKAANWPRRGPNVIELILKLQARRAAAPSEPVLLLFASAHCYFAVNLSYIAPANLFKYLLLYPNFVVDFVWIIRKLLPSVWTTCPKLLTMNTNIIMFSGTIFKPLLQGYLLHVDTFAPTYCSNRFVEHNFESSVPR